MYSTGNVVLHVVFTLAICFFVDIKFSEQNKKINSIQNDIDFERRQSDLEFQILRDEIKILNKKIDDIRRISGISKEFLGLFYEEWYKVVTNNKE